MPWSTSDGRPRDPTVQRGLQLMGAALRRRREFLRLSQRELARRTGVSQSAISRFEAGVQFGIRWSRFARIVVELGGLDFDLDGANARARPLPRSWSQLRAEIVAQEIAALDAVLEEAASAETDEVAAAEIETDEVAAAEAGPPAAEWLPELA